MRRIFSCLLAVVLCSSIFCHRGSAQTTAGRWLIGISGGANYINADFEHRKISPAAEVLLRYGFTRNFSLGLALGFDEFKEQGGASPQWPYDYLHIRGFDAVLLAHVHFAVRKSFSPYAYAGVGAMMFQRMYWDNQFWNGDDKFKTSFLIPVGLGFDWFISRNVALTAKAGYTLIGDAVDIYTKLGGADHFPTARIGFNFYFGSSDADDDDSDGLSNGEERRVGSDPENPDTDGDRLKDGEEIRRYSTNPLLKDTDGDGLDDGEEVFVYKTDPAKSDTDQDGLSDGDEVRKYKTDPLKADTDGDGIYDGEEVLKLKTDPLRIDTDGDGLTDWEEVRTNKTDPLKADTDGDGLKDGDEVRKYGTNPLLMDTDKGGVNDGAEVARGTNPLDPKDDVPAGALRLERGSAVILQGVNFESGSARLTKKSEAILEKALLSLMAAPTLRIEIAGHTDSQGDPKTNESLSRWRAETVKQWFIDKRIQRNRLATVGYGPRQPIATNATAEGRARNRRIELRVK